MLHRLPALVAALVLVAFAAGAAHAQEAQDVGRIAAVVNDDAISVTDLQDRMRLALLSSGLDATAENQQRLLPQVLRVLIDERLQAQEAARANIVPSKDEVNRALDNIARQNGLSTQALFEQMKRAGVPASTLENQVTAQLAWRQLIRTRFAANVEIPESEIDEVVAEIQANQGRPEYLVAEIFLAVDPGSNEAEVLALGQRLVTEIQRGAPFPAVAQQFSQAAGAQNGGDMGWVQEGQLDPALDQVLRGMRPGQLSSPIRTLTGYHILLLRDARRVGSGGTDSATVRLNQLVVPAPADASDGDLQQIAQQVASDFAGVQGCEAFAAKAVAVGVQGGIDAGQVRLGQLPTGLRDLIGALPVGELSPPQRSQGGIGVYMVCERSAGSADSGPEREQIRNSLTDQRIDMLQRRLLRDLRATAFVDIRL